MYALLNKSPHMSAFRRIMEDESNGVDLIVFNSGVKVGE
jgi:hypothetical protein